MLRKALTILSLIALMLCVALFLDVPILAVVAIVLAMSGASWIVGVLMRPFRERKKIRDAIRTAKDSGALCANCGYNMEGQALPRCPECGALRGFTASVEQLGLTEQEIRKGFDRKREADDSHGVQP